jgi:hypothetical protein
MFSFLSVPLLAVLLAAKSLGFVAGGSLAFSATDFVGS